MNEGGLKQEMDRWNMALYAVLRVLIQSMVVKEELIPGTSG